MSSRHSGLLAGPRTDSALGATKLEGIARAEHLDGSSMLAQYDLVANPLEQAGYLEFGGEHLYTVLHRVADPIARVLLVGPFASERHFSYIPWVKWARFLAARRIETLRYDYRGVGESTGVFEHLSFEDWNEDVRFLAGWLANRSPEIPLLLHGLELGALLASNAFAAGNGSGLLLWSAPANANEVLRKALLRRIIIDQMFKSVDQREPLSALIKRLESGESLEVEGYEWSAKLWRDSFNYEMRMNDVGESIAVGKADRPVRVVKLEKSAAPLVKGSALGYVISLNPDLSLLFADNFDWLASALPAQERQ